MKLKEMVKSLPQVKVFGRMLVEHGDATFAFRQAISDFLREADVSLSRLSMAAGGALTGGANIASFIHGSIRITPAKAEAIAEAIDRFPKRWPSGAAGKPRLCATAASDGPLYLTQEEHIARMREDAAAKRAAHIEQQRQAEIARYGFTTIDRDVMEMAA